MIDLYPHQVDLTERARAEFRRGCRRVLVQAPTGAGKTVLFCAWAAAAADKGRRSVILAHRVELLDQISATLDRVATPDQRAIIDVRSVWSYLPERGRYDLTIIDEAHHAAGDNTWTRAMDATYHVLGVSATPSRLDGRGLGERWDSLVIGPGVREMIDAGVLSDYVLYRASVPPQTKLRKGVGGDYSSGDALQSVRTVTAGASKQWTEKCPGAQTLAFACTVEHAEQIAAEFTAATSERAAMISGDTPADQRRELMQRFRDRDIRLIASCDVFSEGLDVPGVECAILLRPTASLTLYMQQIGRAMRRKDRPAVILDMAGNSHRHGLPCEPRDWSLDGGVQRPASPPTPRQCGACFAAAPAHATVCPGCGRAWPKKKLEIVEVDAELIEAMKRSEERRNAATLEALKKIARQRGYKPGWAEHVMAARSRKRARA